MSESEILKIQEKIKKLKFILETTKEMRQQVNQLVQDAGIHINYGECADLRNVDRNVNSYLNDFRLTLARLRDE